MSEVVKEVVSAESPQKYKYRIMLNGHMGGPINCVQFAPQGLSLASGGIHAFFNE